MSSKQQVNRPTIESGETAYDMAQSWGAASTGLHPRDEGPTQIVLLKILHWCRTAYRLGEERYRQRRQLMEMDDRQLKDIGITREQAEQEARKPIWKGWQLAHAANRQSGRTWQSFRSSRRIRLPSKGAGKTTHSTNGLTPA